MRKKRLYNAMLAAKSKTGYSLYLAALLFIFGWWCLAFWPSTSAFSTSLNTNTTSYPQRLKELNLTPLSRDAIHKALAGDVQIMTQLMAEWEIEAQILLKEGYAHAKHLPQDAFLRGQKIGRQLKKTPTHLNSTRFLPQTYVSASFLLSLLSPTQIVAIPQGLREQTQLFPPTLTQALPTDVEQSSEKLYHLHPQIAFVAPYSYPATLEKLKTQGVKLINLPCACNFEELTQTLKQVGVIVENPLKAELLALFMESALAAIDNRILVLSQDLHPTPQILYLTYHSHFALPSENTLLGSLLNRLQINTHIEHSSAHQTVWEHPLKKEQIVSLNPDCIILSSNVHLDALIKLFNDHAFKHTSAIANKKVFVVDAQVQESPSQYILLAYFDIYQAILTAMSS